MLAKALRRISELGFAPTSAGAIAFALICVAVAAVLRYGLGQINADVVPFATFFPAVLVVTFFAGVPAAIVAILLSLAAVHWLFEASAGGLELLNAIVFTVTCTLMVVLAESYRQLVAMFRSQEKQKNLMLRELEHRGKNTFSVVESIVLQTLAHDSDVAKVIIGRIHAVSSTNDIISHAANLQPDLRTLVRSKFEPFDGFRARLTGPDITLPADSARNLSLVFHELVTNAIKHGALSIPEGHVDISWHADESRLMIHWVERGGPPTAPPEQHGFGSRLVVGCMKGLGGRFEVSFAPEGLACKITMPYRRSRPAMSGRNSAISNAPANG